MPHSRIARHYAEILLEVARQQGRLEEVSRDVAELRELLRQSRPLVLFFRSPLINRDRKQAVVQELFAGRIEELLFRFLEVLVQKGREAHLVEALEAFEELRDEALGILRVQLEVAVEPGLELYEKIRSALATYTGRNIVARLHVDRALIGGLRIRLPNRVIDGSVRHQLELIRQRLKSGYALN